MKRASLAVLALLLLSATTTASAARRAFAIPPMPLDAALRAFAIQSGLDIGTSETGLARTTSAAVAGTMSSREAIGRLLAGSVYGAVPLAAGGYRIERLARAARMPARGSASPPPRDGDAPAPELVVTAGKRDAALLRFPGSVTVMRLDRHAPGVTGSAALADVAAQAPTVQATALGAGRNKLFVRGIADSSFLGPTQSTTSVYFGDTLLAYNGAAPNLTLYDVDRIEILEGPQGTLYGAGAIGGVIKVTPRAPDLGVASGSAAAGVTVTRGGTAGHDEAAMLNLPLVDERLALRLVGYEARDGGYVDDRRRGRRDVNSTETRGGRTALRFAPGDGWTIEAGTIWQKIDAPDSQYALRGLPGLARRSTLAQPFRDDFLLGRLAIAKSWDSGLRLVSATGLVRQHARDRFDATLKAASPIAYDVSDRNMLVTQETRLSRTSADGDSWLVGAALLRDRDVTARDYGPPAAERDIVGVTNRTIDFALFGEATLAVTPALAVTAGARLTRARLDSAPSVTRNVGPFVRGRSQTRVDPALGASWLVARRVALFARYQRGFRTGGLAVAAGIGRVADFRSDDIRVGEAGVRLERAGALGLAASAALSHARWRNIQADLVDSRGFPFTANVGTGSITGVETVLDWVPRARLRLTAGFFLASSLGAVPDRTMPRPRATRLPDTPRVSATAAIAYERRAGGGTARLGASARYVGSSYLDPSALLNIRQGNYTDVGITAGWRVRSLAFSLDIDNLANARGDRFALGNPFGVASGDQFTPLRPRNARLSAAIAW